ncbi:MAG: NERD domain-containing protein, partial [Cytophagales bacterium]|nr:NERD domain-containing protein [Cytophagales bacterium]
MAEIVYCGKYDGPVNAGEERLHKFLEANLPEKYLILPGIELANVNPKNNQVQYLEYDCIVVTPHAIYNIENKDYSGRLEGDDDYWYHRDKEMKNPHKTLRFKTGVLASKLKDHNTKWTKAWIQSVVTLSNTHQSLQGLYGNHTKATFLLNEKLIEYITDPYSVGKIANDILDIYQELANAICGTAKPKDPTKKREVEGYEIVEILDQDKNFTEYLAKPKGVTSAVKKRIKEYYLDIPKLSDTEREKRELQIKNAYSALNRIKSNPFILNVQFKIDEEEHRFYEITDYLDENTLRAEMKRRTFTFEDKLRIINNLIAALKAAHEADVFHRDLNPENVYLTGGYACLGNFGKSYFSEHYEAGFTVMATITEQNATAYHPLELIQRDASRSSDIYSLGVLAYELFVGSIPFKTPFELNKLGGKLPENRLPSTINPALPKWLDEFCNHCIRTSPEDRWDNMEEMESFLIKKTD